MPRPRAVVVAGTGSVAGIIAVALALIFAGNGPDATAAITGTAATTAPNDAEFTRPALRPTNLASDLPLREHADDIADYTLRARLDPLAHTVHGEGTIRWKNASAVPVRELWLHLYLNAFKNERSTFLREPVGGFRGSEPLTDWGTIDLERLSLRGPASAGVEDVGQDLLPAMREARAERDDADVDGGDETEARVPLPREVLPGESITLDMTWDDKLPSIVERTGYSGSFHFIGQWFPKLARLEPDGTWAHFSFHHLAEFYADFGTYDVTLDVPDGFTLGATGPAVSSRHEAGRTFERHVQADVHDFAWTAWDRYEARDERIDGVQVHLLFPHGYTADAERELAAIRFSLPYFGRLYGPYPYDVLTVVHPPESATEAGGMEYPTLITTGGAWHGEPFTRLVEVVTVHELGHQYFYGLLASNEVLWPFLDEGVNSFAEADVLREMFGAGSTVSAQGLTVSDEAIQAVFSNLSEHDAKVAQPAYAFATGGLYSSLVYERTGAVLETLRRVYGDAAMKRALGAYARTFRFQHPGPEDFIRSFEEGLGGDAAASLRRALFDKGWVDYAVVEVVSHESAAPRGIFDKNGARETVRDGAHEKSSFEGWVLVLRRGTLSFPVEVELTFADGTRQRVPWDGRAESVRIPYRGPEPLSSAVVDPEHAVILDDDLSNNHGSSAEAHEPGAPRVLERAAYWAELFTQVLGP